MLNKRLFLTLFAAATAALAGHPLKVTNLSENTWSAEATAETIRWQWTIHRNVPGRNCYMSLGRMCEVNETSMIPVACKKFALVGFNFSVPERVERPNDDGWDSIRIKLYDQNKVSKFEAVWTHEGNSSFTIKPVFAESDRELVESTIRLTDEGDIEIVGNAWDTEAGKSAGANSTAGGVESKADGKAGAAATEKNTN